MKADKVAAQLYTVRDHLRTPADIARSMARIAGIGYRAVQVSGMGAIPEADLRRILDDNGLVCCATHEGNVLDAPERVVERLRALGCRHTAFPHPGKTSLNTRTDVEALARRLDRAGAVLRQGDCVLTYHNHDLEFRRVDGKPILQWLYELTDPQNLQAELDTYWIHVGGDDPAGWCERMRDRLPLLHMKDVIRRPDGSFMFGEIGRGMLDWPAIVSAAEASGCEWFIVEQDACEGDPFESLRMSHDHIRTHLAVTQQPCG